MLTLATIVLGILCAGCGAWLLFFPKSFMKCSRVLDKDYSIEKLRQLLDTEVDTDSLRRLLEKNIDVNEKLFKISRLIGLVALIVGLFLLFTFVQEAGYIS